MCFSAQASFAAGVVISTIGVATLNKVSKPSHKLFASIPLLFGIQQIAEGFLWVTIPGKASLDIQQFCAYIFIIIALVVWPTMIPMSTWMMEENPKKKKIIKFFLGLGVVLSVYYASCLALIGVQPEISCYHIVYKGEFPLSLALPAFFVYVVVTITPLFVSSIRRMKFMGAIMFFSVAVSAMFFKLYLTSVWCFFAAVLSGIVYYIVAEYEKEYAADELHGMRMA
jgi:hypothetical protein